MLAFDAARERMPLGGTAGRGRGPKRRSVPPATLAREVPDAEEMLAVLWLLWAVLWPVWALMVVVELWRVCGMIMGVGVAGGCETTCTSSAFVSSSGRMVLLVLDAGSTAGAFGCSDFSGGWFSVMTIVCFVFTRIFSI